MGKTVRLGFGVILMSYLASCAGMEVSPVSKSMAPAPLPQYTVGDAFVFDSGIVNDTQTVVAVDERTVTLESNVFGTLTQHRDFGLPESWTGGLTQAYTTTAVTTPSGLFPLKVGNRSNVTGVYIYS